MPSFIIFQLFPFSPWGFCLFSFLRRFPVVLLQLLGFLPVFIHQFPAVLLQSFGFLSVFFRGFQLLSFSQWRFCLFSWCKFYFFSIVRVIPSLVNFAYFDSFLIILFAPEKNLRKAKNFNGFTSTN